ncbi:MAG TPA: hypothetical protein VMP68_31830 [Candidatus Eisenbacteria bacterium]|nr:hypothetical protein [Candidatus Eisenbacteria bacterium]
MRLTGPVLRVLRLFDAPLLAALVSVVLMGVSPAGADNAAFDLIGPKVDVRVQRSGTTLPIAEVPNLQAGDRLWIHPDLPQSQSVHYLMIVAFLRGATNPPPDSWFTRVETWSRSVHDEGIFVVVPDEAEEALIFLAPETGGAFSTLRTAVRGKPGAFVRAAQDLQQASLDRQRLEKYLDSVRDAYTTEPEQLKAHTTLLARSLSMRLDQQCFDKPSAQQVPCLTQNTENLVLDDAHSQNMVATLTSSTSADLLAQISSTPSARSGFYSPYIGAVVDVVRILGTTHTAQYQYIPALALPKQDELNLRLNNPPSFRNPKSVLVIGLPPIRTAPPPPLRAIDPNQVLCAGKPSLLLAADGAPLVFATDLAHNLVLHVEPKSGPAIDLPAKPDAELGGFVVETHALESADLDSEVTGTIRGLWGFHAFEGPHYRLRTSRPAQWIVASKDASALIVGREDTLHLQSQDACCVSEVTLKDEQGKVVPTEWKNSKSDELEVKVPLQKASAGWVTMEIKKFGLHEVDQIPLHTYAEAARLDTFTIHAGDADGLLKGTRLDQVASLDLNGIHFAPDSLTRANQQDELKLVTTDPTAKAKIQTGDSISAHVALKDGRTLDVKAEVEAPRPAVTILTKSIQTDQSAPPAVRLGSQEELPQDARLNFFLKTQSPETFSPTEKIEVATSDESFRVLLSFKDGNLTMQDTKTVLAVLDPMKLLGPSAFGPLKIRPVTPDGINGDWQPLVNLVRIPMLKAVRCVPAPEKQCTLSGDKLFLLDSVSSDADFTNSVSVPEGFVEDALAIPPPKGKMLYIKLRDDPATIDTVALPVPQPEQ